MFLLGNPFVHFHDCWKEGILFGGPFFRPLKARRIEHPNRLGAFVFVSSKANAFWRPGCTWRRNACWMWIGPMTRWPGPWTPFFRGFSRVQHRLFGQRWVATRGTPHPDVSPQLSRERSKKCIQVPVCPGE